MGLIVMFIMAAMAGVMLGFILAMVMCHYYLEEEREREAKRARKRRRAMAIQKALESAQEGKDASSKVIPIETAIKGKGSVRGAYRGPDGVVTFIGQ